MDIVLEVTTLTDGAFEVYSSIRPAGQLWDALNSVLIVDYNYAPWIRKEGNLLWS